MGTRWIFFPFTFPNQLFSIYNTKKCPQGDSWCLWGSSGHSRPVRATPQCRESSALGCHRVLQARTAEAPGASPTLIWDFVILLAAT